MAHDVFISHSARDKAVADSVCSALENGGIGCWMAPRDVRPGRSFAGEITRAIQESKVMVLIVSGPSNQSQQVLREVQLAVESNLHILQLRIENLVLNDDLKYFLGTPQWLDAFAPPFEQHLKRLLRATSELLGRPPFPVPGDAKSASAPQSGGANAGGQPETPAGVPAIGQSAFTSSSRPSSFRKPVFLAGSGLVLAVALSGVWYAVHLQQLGKNPAADRPSGQMPPGRSVANAEEDYELGLQYFRGGGNVSIDWRQALNSFVRAANQEMPEAEAEAALLCQYQSLYDFGEALPSTPPEQWAARAWKHGLETRAKGSPQAAYEAGQLCSVGLGIKQDAMKAREWHERAVAQGSTDAKRALGFAYFAGSGVSKDLAKARSYLEEAVAANNAPARILLGLVYLSGGDKNDEPRAIELFKTAAEQGLASADEQLATEYEEGKRVEKDLVESAKRRRKAAEKGLWMAIYKLALMYENGTGVSKDLAEAERLLEKPAANGYPHAKEALERVRRQMTTAAKTP